MINPFINLPKELFKVILSFTTGKDVTRCKRVSKVFYQILHESSEIICCNDKCFNSNSFYKVIQCKANDKIIKIIQFAFKLKTFNKEFLFNKEKIRDFIEHAIYEYNLEVLEELIKYINNAGDLVEIFNQDCVLMSCEKGDEIILKFLRSIDPSLISVPTRATFLGPASQAGYVKIVRELLNHSNGSIKATICFLALIGASKKGHIEVVRELLKYMNQKFDSIEDDSSIGLASANGHLEVVQELLLEKRIDPAANHSACIRWASKNNHLAIVRLLLKDPRVDPSALRNEALQNARKNRHLDVVKELLLDPRVQAHDKG